MAAENELSEVEALKLELQLLKCEVAELRDENSSLKQSPDEAVRSLKPQTAMQPGSVIELQEKLNQKDEELNQKDEELKQKNRQLNMTVQLLNETRKELSEVQERLTVAEQVMAATQRRELDGWPHDLNHTNARCHNVVFQRGSNQSVTWQSRGLNVHVLAGVD